MGLLSSIGKFLFGGKKKSSQTETTGTTTSDPWAFAIPSIQRYVNDTNELYGPDGAPQISGLEQNGYNLLQDTIDSDNTAIQPAIAENNKTLHGDYLNPDTNPYIKDIASRIGGIAGTTAAGNFGGAGRTGSGLAGYYSGKGAADAAGEIYFNNYNNERGRMGEAVGRAPSLEAGRFLAPQALISAGQNVSSRPFDLNQQRGSILSSIGSLGGSTNSTGKSTNYGYSPGLIGGIVNSFTNKLFPGVTPW